MALTLKTVLQFPIFAPPSPHHHRPATEIRFSRWNNANAQKFIRHERTQKETEDQLRFHKRFESAGKIADLQPTATTPPPFKSTGTPSAPSRSSIPGKKSKYSKPPQNPNSHPAFERIVRIRKIPNEIEDETVIKIGDNGLSYVIPEAPFEFQYSYTETPKIKPLKLREPPIAPFGPGTMPRSWTGKKPLPPSKKKVDFDSFTLPPPHKKGVKPVQAPGPFLPGSGPKYVQSREEILGEPLSKEEIDALVKGCLKSSRQLNMGRDGFTHNMLDNIHAHWKRRRVCKIKCKGVCTVDMDNVRQQLEDKTGGKVIYSKGGVVYLFRGRNYNYRTRPVFPLMLWKPVTPVYPRLIQRVPEGLTLEEASEMRKKGRELTPICKLGGGHRQSEHATNGINQDEGYTGSNGSRSFRDILMGRKSAYEDQKIIIVDNNLQAFVGLQGRALEANMIDMEALKNINLILKEISPAGGMIQYLGGVTVLLSFLDNKSAVSAMEKARDIVGRFSKIELFQVWVREEEGAWVPEFLSGDVQSVNSRVSNEEDIDIVEEGVDEMEDREDLCQPIDGETMAGTKEVGIEEERPGWKSSNLETDVEIDPHLLQDTFLEETDNQEEYLPGPNFLFENPINVEEDGLNGTCNITKRKKINKWEDLGRPSCYSSSGSGHCKGKKARSKDPFGLNDILGLEEDRNVVMVQFNEETVDYNSPGGIDLNMDPSKWVETQQPDGGSEEEPMGSLPGSSNTIISEIEATKILGESVGAKLANFDQMIGDSIVQERSQLGKNGVYCDLVNNVREAFEACDLVRINCEGMNGSDNRKIGAKLKDLAPCVLISFEHEHILVWRGQNWKSMFPQDNKPQEAKNPDTVEQIETIISTHDDNKIITPVEIENISENTSNQDSLTGVMSLLKQAVQDGIAFVLEDSHLDADVVYAKAVAFSKSAQPGPTFRHYRPKKVAIVSTETREDEETVVNKEVVTVCA
ncbi:hypothetical protein L1987_87673 [Smallanthus sonchifolius]|nr:hypothetical protein L1987_87673 [Smallanthus sonchifolius]